MARNAFKMAMKFIPNRKAGPSFDAKYLAAQIEGAQEVVDHAVNHHPYQDPTGTNTGSIGWAASSSGKATFGRFSFSQAGRTRGEGGRFVAGSGGGDVDTSILSAFKKRRSDSTVVVATSSGYGGFLEIGTSIMAAFAYIVPALRAKKAAIMRALDGVLGKHRQGQRLPRGS